MRDTPKSKVIPVRMDPDTHQLIEKAAAMTGHTLSSYLRHAARSAALREVGHPSSPIPRRRTTNQDRDLPESPTLVTPPR